MFDNKNITAELTIFGDSPEEMKNAKIIETFKTSSSESYLVDVGAFDDDMRMYVLAERFKSTGWKWSNSFPEMDALQLADYLEGCAELTNDGWEDYEKYKRGLFMIVGRLRDIGSEQAVSDTKLDNIISYHQG